MGKCRMSRRIRRQYDKILDGTVVDYYGQLFYSSRQQNLSFWAFCFYKQHGKKHGIDFHRIQRIVLLGSMDTVYRWAMEIPGANIRKCQAITITKGSSFHLRRFAMNVLGAYSKELEDMALVKDVFSV